MSRRQGWASVLLSLAVITPMFALGAILDWPDEYFAWLAIGAPAVGMTLGTLLFYKPTAIHPRADGPRAELAESLARLTRRVEALEKQARKQDVGQESDIGTPAEPSAARTQPHS
jgi:hypothetical protein